MKHSDKDIEAADAYAGQFNNPTYEQNAFKAFLAGCEHKQKDVDELVDGFNLIIKHLPYDVLGDQLGEDYEMIDKLIQKHKITL